jgi:hypothetical protein
MPAKKENKGIGAFAEAARVSSTVIGGVLGITLILAGIAALIAWLAGAL